MSAVTHSISCIQMHVCMYINAGVTLRARVNTLYLCFTAQDSCVTITFQSVECHNHKETHSSHKPGLRLLQAWLVAWRWGRDAAAVLQSQGYIIALHWLLSST